MQICIMNQTHHVAIGGRHSNSTPHKQSKLIKYLVMNKENEIKGFELLYIYLNFKVMSCFSSIYRPNRKKADLQC